MDIKWADLADEQLRLIGLLGETTSPARAVAIVVLGISTLQKTFGLSHADTLGFLYMLADKMEHDSRELERGKTAS